MPTTLALQPEAQQVIDQIVERFHPEKIILFGSHATGKAREDSDYDLLVVMETEIHTLLQAAEISREVDHLVALDILVRKPVQVSSPSERDIFLHWILDEGIVIYEADN